MVISPIRICSCSLILIFQYLAADRSLYKSYAYKCRKEYSLPDFVYRFGRKRFLNGMLNREYIFSSDVFRQQNEQVARENIQWELEAWL